MTPSDPSAMPPRPGAAGREGIGSGLKGLRVFIAEDEFLVAAVLEDDLNVAGCFIVGPYTSLARAIEASQREAFDIAVLDVNMNGNMVFPLADELTRRGIPFLFLSGYGGMNLPERFRGLPRLSKPYDTAVLLRELDRLAPRKS